MVPHGSTCRRQPELIGESRLGPESRQRRHRARQVSSVSAGAAESRLRPPQGTATPPPPPAAAAQQSRPTDRPGCQGQLPERAARGATTTRAALQWCSGADGLWCGVGRDRSVCTAVGLLPGERSQRGCVSGSAVSGGDAESPLCGALVLEFGDVRWPAGCGQRVTSRAAPAAEPERSAAKLRCVSGVLEC